MLDQARIISQKHSIHTYKLVNILTSLAQVFEDKNQFDTAFNHYLDARNLAQTVDHDTLRFKDIYFKMYSCLKKAGRVQEAIFYCENFLLIYKYKENELMKETLSIWTDAKPIVSRKKILNAKLHDLKLKASDSEVGGVVIKENLVVPSITREVLAQQLSFMDSTIKTFIEKRKELESQLNMLNKGVDQKSK
ncbi:hypothetical protein ACFE04_026782 [Oxalis oulophora]